MDVYFEVFLVHKIKLAKVKGLVALSIGGLLSRVTVGRPLPGVGVFMKLRFESNEASE